MTTGRINQIALGFVQISQLTPPHYFRPRGPSAQGEGIGKVVTFKLGYVRSVSFLQPVSVRKERHRESERVHTDDSQDRTGRSASVRHSIVAHSLFPCPDTSLKERANKLARGGFYVAPCHRMPVAFRKKRNFTPVSQRYFPSADVVSEMRGFRAQSTASPYRPDC